MATVPIHNTPDAKTSDTIERRFRDLEAAWNADTMYLSDAQKIINHPAFQEIIRMGEAVIPFMLRDLEKAPCLWVWALPQITGANPIDPDDAGHIRNMSETWLRWAREHGYQW
ncbi:MAG: hypothetical protein HYR84_05510 [Planctomycetes bacterium]|nr:hypothetical protein [Planctomycetota bacterium]